MIDLRTLTDLRHQLLERDNDLVHQIAPLEEERNTIRQQVELVDQLMSLEQSRTGLPTSADEVAEVPVAPPSAEPEAPGSPSTPDAATQMLNLFEAIKKPLHRSEVAILVARHARAMGLERSPAETTLLARLANDPAKRFKNVARGYWAPASWPDDPRPPSDIGRKYVEANINAQWLRRRWETTRMRIQGLQRQAGADPALAGQFRQMIARTTNEARTFAAMTLRQAARAQGLARELGDDAKFYPPPITIADIESAMRAEARGEQPIEQLTVETV